MSNQQHTPEPWISEGSFIGIPNGKGTFYMVPLSGINQDSREANARRIVACVNACAGIDTGHLEQYGLPDFAQKISDLREQRDDLLDFAKEVRLTGDTRLASMAIAAIASVKGGAA